MTIEELKEQIDKEFGGIERVLGELFTVYRPERTEYTLPEQAAVAAFIVNVYSGFEKILKTMLLYDKLDVDNSPEWHEKILKKSSEIGILPPDLFQIFLNYLSFRNFFIYNYISSIKWENMKAMVEVIRNVTERFRTEVNEYLQTI